MTEKEIYGAGLGPESDPRDLPKDKLVGLLHIYARMYQELDSMWFMSVRERTGETDAVVCGAWVWEKQSKQEAKRLSRYMGTNDGSVSGVVKTLQISPLAFTHDFQVDLISEDEARVIFTRCPSLEEMEREGGGRGGTFCEGLSRFAKQQFASIFNSEIKVTPLQAPAKLHGTDICCQWQFKTG